jgi:hypothetical protein
MFARQVEAACGCVVEIAIGDDRITETGRGIVLFCSQEHFQKYANAEQSAEGAINVFKDPENEAPQDLGPDQIPFADDAR